MDLCTAAVQGAHRGNGAWPCMELDAKRYDWLGTSGQLLDRSEHTGLLRVADATSRLKKTTVSSMRSVGSPIVTPFLTTSTSTLIAVAGQFLFSKTT